MQVQELRWFVAAVEDPNLTRLAGALHGVQDVRDAGDPERGEVRLGFLHPLGTWLVPDLIGAYRVEHPHLRFRLDQSSGGVILAELLAGRHDLLLTGSQPPDPSIAWRELLTEPLRLAVPPGHRLASRRGVALREVANDPFIIFSAETDCARRSTPCARGQGSLQRWRSRARTSRPSAASSRQAWESHFCLADPARPNHRHSSPWQTTDAGAHRSIGLGCHRSRNQSPVAAAFAAFAADPRQTFPRQAGKS